MDALQSMLERVLALPECNGEPSLLLRAYVAGDRSERLQHRLRPETRPADTFADLAVWAALLAVLHALRANDAALAEAIRIAETALDCADEADGPPSLRRPPIYGAVVVYDSDRPTDPCGAPALDGAT